MSRVQLHSPAPDFVLEDFRGQAVQLSDFFSKKNLVLVFNRGFS